MPNETGCGASERVDCGQRPETRGHGHACVSVTCGSGLSMLLGFVPGFHVGFHKVEREQNARKRVNSTARWSVQLLKPGFRLADGRLTNGVLGSACLHACSRRRSLIDRLLRQRRWSRQQTQGEGRTAPITRAARSGAAGPKEVAMHVSTVLQSIHIFLHEGAMRGQVTA